MTPLRSILGTQIAAQGPISLAEYMALCLLHPEHGYYTTRDPLGAAGDFTTAPEISQMFGELLGLSLASSWVAQGQPSRFALAELGPGRGTLMADILRATRGVPGFHDAAEVHLVEASPTLRAVQATSLQGFAPTWHDTAAQLPGGPLFLVANEFFDALPIRQFQRSSELWQERVVGLSGDKLTVGLAAPMEQAGLEHRLEDTRPDDIVETCAPATGIIGEVSIRITQHGGAAIVVDYGDWRSLGNTFQAVEAHESVDPFAAPGRADLTAHVDFEALALAASPAKHSRLVTQGVLLERLGVTPRAQALAAKLSGNALNSHIAAHRRLTHPEEMGSVFKALAIVPEGETLPPGFEA